MTIGLQRWQILQQTAFVDNKLYIKIKSVLGNKPTQKQDYPEYEFIASCLRVGLTINDLDKMTYIEVQKILYSFLEKEKDNVKVRKATQEDWDRLMQIEARNSLLVYFKEENMGRGIKGIIVEIGGDTSALENSLKHVKSSTASLNKELRGINSLLKLDPKNTELVSQKQTVLAKNIKETETHLNNLKEAQQRYIESGGDLNNAEYRNLQREIINTENKLKNYTLIILI